MMTTQRALGYLSLFLASCFGVLLQAAEPKAKEKHQYASESYSVSIPTANEARVATFDAQSIAKAKEYIEGGAISWVQNRGCVNCHTTGPYMAERPSLVKQLGRPNEDILQNFIDDVPQELEQIREVERKGHRYYPRSYYAVWRSVGLAEWDKHITGKLSEHTDRSLRDMFSRQSENGSFVTYGEVEIPHITTNFELSLQAARAVTTAPGWIRKLQDPEVSDRLENLKSWLRSAKPKNDYDRILRLQLAQYFPNLVSKQQIQSSLELLSEKQHPDGGWSTRDMSALEDWHYEISDYVQALVTHLPDASSPESDAYMTAFAIVLLRMNDVPAEDPRIKSGIAWLKREQRVSGRWWMHSLYRGNFHYTTYIATAQALKALALCDELPSSADNKRR